MKDHTEQGLTLEQRILAESEESAGKYLLTSWFYRAMEEIRDARLRNGLTQQDVAERIGTTQSVIARLENSHQGTFSLKRFLEYAWASGAGPLDFSWVPTDQLRAFASEYPSAPRTLATLHVWKLEDAIRNWGLGTGANSSVIDAACRIKLGVDPTALAAVDETKTTLASGSTQQRIPGIPLSTNSFQKRDANVIPAAESKAAVTSNSVERMVAA